MLTIDYILLGVLIVSLAVGAYRGFFRQALSLAPWLVAVWAAFRFGHVLDPILAFFSFDALGAWSAPFIAFILILVAAWLIKALVGRLLAGTGLARAPGRVEEAPPAQESGPAEVGVAAEQDDSAMMRAADPDIADLDFERAEAQPALDAGTAGVEDETAGFVDITDLDFERATGETPEPEASAGELADDTLELEAVALTGEDVDLDFSDLTTDMDLDLSELGADLDLDIAEPDTSASGGAQPAARAPTADAGAWAVEVGRFAKADNVERLVAALGTQGFDVFVTLVDGSDGPMYGVRVGPVDGRDDAEALAARLQAAGQQGEVVPSE